MIVCLSALPVPAARLGLKLSAQILFLLQLYSRKLVNSYDLPLLSADEPPPVPCQRASIRSAPHTAALNLRYCFDSLRKSVNSSDELNRQPDFLAAAVSSAVSRLGRAADGGDASAARLRPDLQCHVRRFSARLRFFLRFFPVRFLGAPWSIASLDPWSPAVEQSILSL